MLLAAFCLAAGMIMAGIGWLLGGRGFNLSFKNGFSFGQNEDYTYQNMDMEAFDEIYINVRNCPVQIYPSTDGKYGVDVKLETADSEKVILEVVDGRLEISTPDGLQFHFLDWNFDFFETNYHVSVYLPKKVCDSIYVSTSNGSVVIEGVDTGDGKLSVNTSNGAVTLTDVYAAELKADTSNASVIMENVRADSIVADTSNGRVSFDTVEAEEIHIDTSNGGINFNTVYGKEAVLDTTNGSVVLDTVHFSEKLEVDTSNSSIDVLLDGKKQEYSIAADTSNSNVYIDDEKFDDDYKGSDGKAKVELDTSNGRIIVKFK